MRTIEQMLDDIFETLEPKAGAGWERGHNDGELEVFVIRIPERKPHVDEMTAVFNKPRRSLRRRIVDFFKSIDNSI